MDASNLTPVLGRYSPAIGATARYRQADTDGKAY
jgi:hypothetical protein